jgi:integrase
MNAMIKRSATVIKLPIDHESLINSPENIILDFGQKGTLDIGALCYLTRDNKFNRCKRYITRPVDLNSYCEERAHHIQKLILDTSKSIQFSETSTSKAHYQIQAGLIPFINWIDEHGHHKSFYSEASARPVFREYNLFVLRRISKGEINSTTASAQIRSLLSILNQHLNIENLHEGVNIPRKKISETNTTEPVEEASQARFLSLCKTLFDGLSNFVINNHPYPFALHPPKHLAVDNHTMWIRPKSKWLAYTPSKKQTGDELFSYYFPETPIHLDGDTLDTLFSALKNKLKKEEKNLKQANANRNSHHRRRMAKIAHDAFFQLFLAHTGVNLTQASQLWWEGDYSLEMDRQGFRTIKWRARGLVQSFEIQSIFTKDFKAFLELRKYLLKKNTASHLFFKLGSKGKSQPKPVTSTDSGNFYKILLKIDPELPKITSRQWRASKADWMLRNGVPSQITAIALQNSEATIRKSYAAGSPITHRQEMSTFGHLE